MESYCTDEQCKGETGASRDFVLANLMQKIGQEMILMDEVEEDVMVIWPVPEILQTLLSPHNRAFCGLLTGGFRTPNLGENICLCCSSTTSNAPDSTISPTHSNTSASLTLISPSPSTPPPGTSTTTIVPSPSTVTTTNSPTHPCPSPAPAHSLEPLQAHSVDDIVMEDMDTNVPHTHHTI